MTTCPAATVAVYRSQLFRPSETFITEQARHLASYRPVMVGREVHGPVPRGIEAWVPPRWGRVRRGAFTLVSRPDAYSGYLRERGARLVHAHFAPDAVAIRPVARRLGVPLMVTIHGFDGAMGSLRLLASGRPAWIRYAVSRRALARDCALIVCVSDYLRDRVLAQGFPRDRVVRHYIGTDLEALAGPYPLRDRDAPIILHVARLVEKKGTEYLLRAFAKARDVSPEARLVVIGEGPLRARLEQLTRELGIGQAVQYLGAQPHPTVLDWLRRASLFALPSVTAGNGDSEGLPISIIEAAAAALPVVATRHSGIPEAVEHGTGGLLVGERDTAALAAALRDLLADRELRERMGRAAHALVAARFDIRVQSAALESLYHAAGA